MFVFGLSSFECFIALKEIEIPPLVSTLDIYAFAECSSLKNVVFDSKSCCDFIPDYIFKDCTSIQEIVIPQTVLFISESAFKNCEELKNVSLSPSILIGDNAFKNYKYLKVDTKSSVEKNSKPKKTKCILY